MKQVIGIIALTIVLFSCNQEPKNSAVLTGNVENLTDGFFILGGPGGSRDSIKPDSTGAFSYTVDNMEKPGNYYILAGGNDYAVIRLEPGMELEITFDKSDFKNSLKTSGKGSDVNNYLITKAKKFDSQDYEAFKMEPDQFRVYQDSILNGQKALLAEAPKDNPEHEFWKTEEAEILFGWANNLGIYGPYHGYFTQNTGFKVPEGFDSYKREIDINNPEYIKSAAFKQYLSQLIYTATDEKTRELKKADSTKAIDEVGLKMATAVGLISNEAVLNRYLLDDITTEMQWKDLSDIQTSIDFFLDRCKDQGMIDEFNESYESWKKLDRGQPAFEFSGKDMQGNTVKLSDFRGKLVYVDVWATWCGPCLQEIPYLDTLETDYHGKDIVFISYSIDEDHDAWMKFVPEKQLKGVQIIGEKAWESQLCKDYKIRGVPTFMFFDREGKIISVKMSRPSDPKTRETFDLNLTTP